MSTGHKGYGHYLKKRSIRALILAAICITVAVLAVIIINSVLVPSAKYNHALRAMDEYNYLRAVREFVQLDNYKDSLTHTVFCLEEIYGVDLNIATTTALCPWWKITTDGQISFNQDEYDGDGNLVIPDVIDGIIVTAVAEYGFSNSYDIVSIEIPVTVTTINSGAFYYCTGMQSIAIPSSVKKIGDGAFFSNMSLKTVQLPSSLNSLGAGAFENCANLVSVNIPKRISVIDANTFHGCSSLATVYYHGTESNWNAVDVGAKNEPLLTSEIIFEQ